MPESCTPDVDIAAHTVLFMTQLDVRPQPGDAGRGTAPASGGVRGKGLGGNSVGLVGSAVIGISTVAPVYCLTSTLGSTAGEVGVQMPAVFLAGLAIARSPVANPKCCLTLGRISRGKPCRSGTVRL